MTHAVADRIEAIGFNLLAAENQNFLVAFQHLLGAGSHLPHGVLHVFTDITEALGNDADRNRDNRGQDDQDHRKLPAVIEHHGEQRDDRRPFTHHGHQCTGRG
ncbi:hypothetical protein D3C87_1855100 [compost metagenome]